VCSAGISRIYPAAVSRCATLLRAIKCTALRDERTGRAVTTTPSSLAADNFDIVKFRVALQGLVGIWRETLQILIVNQNKDRKLLCEAQRPDSSPIVSMTLHVVKLFVPWPTLGLRIDALRAGSSIWPRPLSPLEVYVVEVFTQASVVGLSSSAIWCRICRLSPMQHDLNSRTSPNKTAIDVEAVITGQDIHGRAGRDRATVNG
jgi:hypothetical protein